MDEMKQKQAQYLLNVRSLINPYLKSLEPETMRQIISLVDHGEPAEGVNYLAWAIVNENKMVPADTVEKIREYTAGLIAPEHMPENLDEHISQ